MGVVRLLAWILVALALALFGADGISSLEAEAPVLRSTQHVLALFGVDVAPAEDGAWAGTANFLLRAPLWALTGVVGILLVLIFRPID